jgi:site-specific DNA-methyltransferase (adenine-specific)
MLLYNADCLEVLKGLPPATVDLVVTDPPYEITGTKGGGSINKVKHMVESMKQLRTAKIDKGYDFEAVNTELVRVMKNINIYIWCNKVQIIDYFNFYVNKLGCKYDILCWHKTNPLPAYNNKYLTDTEYCLYFRKGGYCNPAETEGNRYENAKTYYIAPLNVADKKLWNHPTIKPLDFTEKIIRNSSRKGETVLDPFMGSGTTGVACKNLGRNFIGIELSKEYFEIAEKRIETC